MHLRSCFFLRSMEVKTSFPPCKGLREILKLECVRSFTWFLSVRNITIKSVTFSSPRIFGTEECHFLCSTGNRSRSTRDRPVCWYPWHEHACLVQSLTLVFHVSPHNLSPLSREKRTASCLHFPAKVFVTTVTPLPTSIVPYSLLLFSKPLNFPLR